MTTAKGDTLSGSTKALVADDPNLMEALMTQALQNGWRRTWQHGKPAVMTSLRVAGYLLAVQVVEVKSRKVMRAPAPRPARF